jgi:hypothetical protein
MDESGDLGFDFSKEKTTNNFIITIVYFSNLKKLHTIVKKIHRLKRIHKPKTSSILHAYKETKSIRIKMLHLIAKDSNDIRIMCICLNKKKVYTKLHDEKNFLYNYVVNILLDRIKTKKLIPEGKSIKLIASRKDTNKFLNKNFKKYLEDNASTNTIKISVEIKNPQEEKCLQAVDFISWAIFRKHEHHDEEYRNIIKDRLIEEGWLYK